MSGALLLVTALAPARVTAQEPDTVPARPDTLRADTLRADSAVAQDTVPPPPPPRLPPLHAPVPAGFATGVWVWDRDALLAEPYLSVNDLLDRIPGVITIRSGFHLQPEAASAWGASGAGIEVVLDGYTMWGLEDPTFDLARIELGTLESVRIERRAAGLRIVLHTVEAFSGEPYTRIEASIGEPIAVNLFRGQFLTPHLGFGPFGAAVERLDVEGIGRGEPADMFSGWLKWGLTRERYGAQIEYRQQSLERESGSPYAGKFARRDVIMRARWIATDGLTLEAYGGHSSAEIKQADTTGDLADVAIERDVIQLGTRAALQRGPLAVEAGFRFNNERRMPLTQLDARSWLQLGRIVGIGGEVRHASWRDGDATTSFQLDGVVTPVPQLSLFAQLGGGTLGAPAWGDDERRIIESEHTTLRGGAQLRWRGIDIGGALLSVERDSLFGFRLPFDSAADPLAGDTHRGWELYGRVPLFRDILAVDGGITTWFDGISGIYN
ncbi:MAG: TonB-dependent receptor plug domain-containing protein, partial [Longimicrobiales bacterium]